MPFIRDIPQPYTWLHKAGRKRIIEYPFLCFETNSSLRQPRRGILDNNKWKTKKHTVENYLSYFASAPGFEMKRIGRRRKEEWEEEKFTVRVLVIKWYEGFPS
jgi:hypothetical protein